MFLRVRTGVFLGSGTGVILREGTGVVCSGGFPLSVVDPGPPVDASNELGMLVPCPIPG